MKKKKRLILTTADTLFHEIDSALYFVRENAREKKKINVKKETRVSKD